VGRLDLLRVVRLPILLGGLLGYMLGAVFGLRDGSVFDPTLFFVGYIVVALGDLSTHYSNDYYDVDLDRSSPGKTFGGSKLLVGRPDLVPRAIRAAQLFSIASVLAALAATVLGFSPIIIPLAVAANALGWLYSLPPWRLAYRGLGEAAIAVGTGFGVTVTGYLAVKGSIGVDFLLFSTALVLYGLVLAFSLELSDMEVDRAAGKWNLVARFGWRACLRAALLLCIASTALLYIFTGTIVAFVSLIPLATVAIGNLYAKDDKPKRDAVATACIASLFLFLILSVTALMVP
jgi:1,4-dihydroxy-2-naphthoate polyprenyltransferase